MRSEKEIIDRIASMEKFSEPLSPREDTIIRSLQWVLDGKESAMLEANSNAVLDDRVRRVSEKDLLFIQKSIQDNLKAWNYKNEPDLLRAYEIIDKYLKNIDAEHVG